MFNENIDIARANSIEVAFFYRPLRITCRKTSGLSGKHKADLDVFFNSYSRNQHWESLQKHCGKQVVEKQNDYG